MIFLDEVFEWTFVVDWNNGCDEVFRGKILEVESNLELAKYEETNEEEDILFIDKK